TAITNINTQKDNLEKLLAQEEVIKEQISTALDELNTFDEKLDSNTKSIDSYKTQASDIILVLKENLSQLESARKTADQIIAKATSASLSGAYLKEANSRANSARWNFGWVVISLAAISA